jgi:hypothetical protein
MLLVSDFKQVKTGKTVYKLTNITTTSQSEILDTISDNKESTDYIKKTSIFLQFT